jgi:toxin ParE1/3/4
MIVRIAKEAETDLEAIGDHIASDNPVRALSFIRKIREACENLSSFPKRFPLVQRHEHSGLRKFSLGRYLIFYAPRQDEVVIVHILHAASDYDSMQFLQ